MFVVFVGIVGNASVWDAIVGWMIPKLSNFLGLPGGLRLEVLRRPLINFFCLVFVPKTIK